MTYSTFHNHTTYCDGKNTPEEMVIAAINAGCKSIGFSGHSFTSFDTSYCMSERGTRDYMREVQMLKEKYPQIRILCGVEQDYFSDAATDNYDFVIGSVHYVRVGSERVRSEHAGGGEADYESTLADDDGRENACGEDAVHDISGCKGARHKNTTYKYLDVDNTKEMFVENVERYFNGDYYDFCAAYYAQVANVLNKTNCTFVGHFDLVTKFNEDDCLFDTKSERYRKPALDAVRTLCKAGAAFEINTGAMAKGYRSAPYPDTFILDEIARAGCKVVLSADCHDAQKLQYGLDIAERLAKDHNCEIVYEI